MALPEGFSNTLEYFNEATRVLYEYQWLYVHPNTDLFKCNVLESIPSDWRHFLLDATTSDRKNLGLGREIPDAPESLNLFIDKINSLKATLYCELDASEKLENVKGLGFKKQHEISLLGPFILKLCALHNIDYVIDIGCGLGYLTRYLREHKIAVMGIDGNAKFVETARKKHTDIPFDNLYVNTDCGQAMIDLLKKNFTTFDANKNNVCLVALHACADLTVDMLKLFLTMERIKVGAAMPCCYHRLEQVAMHEEEEVFVNFPLSTHLKRALNDQHLPYDVMNRSFLRLACQRTNWKDQTDSQRLVQTKNLLFRNLLQLVAHQDALIVRRRHRKTGTTSSNVDLLSYLGNIQSSYEIFKKCGTLFSGEDYVQLIGNIRRAFDETYQHNEAVLAAFAALQNLIQGVCENLVLLDRCAFINEQGDATQCVTVKVTDECISPRCFALITTKTNTE